MALFCIVSPATAGAGGETYPFLRTAAYPNGTAWQIGTSYGMAINETGYVFFTQFSSTPNIRVFDPAGNEVAGWNGPDGARFRGIAMNSSCIFVADSANNKVRVYSLSGELVRNVTTDIYPVSVSVNSTGHVFVLNSDSKSIQVIPPGGETATAFLSGLTNPWVLAVNKTDYLHVARVGSGPLEIYDRNGTKVTQPSIPAPSAAWGMTFDAADRLYFAEYWSPGLFLGYSPAGTYLGTSQEGYLSYPTGIAVTASGEAYVVSQNPWKVNVFRVFELPRPTPSGPSGSFAAYPESGTAPLTVQFLDYTPNGKSWAWDFGDGGSSDRQYPVHVYNRSGLYTVSETVTDWNGNTGTKTEYHLIRVNDPVTPAPTPVADFSANTTAGPAPMTVAFTDASSPAPTHRWWQFGDGSTSTDANPVHTFVKQGTYTVNLSVWTSLGQATISKPAYITVGPDNRAPVANFTMSCSSGSIPFIVRLTDTSTGNPTSWRWDFDFSSGVYSTAQNPVIKVRWPGTHVIILTARNAYGSSQMTKDITATGSATRAAKGDAISIVG
jgi:PKD repeat protein